MKPFVSRIGIELLSIICVIIFGATAACAAAGNLDPTFGQAGKTAASFGSPILVANAALQSDGKIVVLFSNNATNFTLARFLGNGSIDTTFGSGGTAQTIFANFNFPETVTIQSDGEIVVTGFATNNLSTFFFAVARFNSDGSLDTTFGASGQAVANVTGSLETSVGLLQPDGKILVAGSALLNPKLPPQLAMARFNPDGSADPDFGRNGLVQLISPVNTPSALGVDASGNIFVNAGTAIAEFRPGRQPRSASDASRNRCHGACRQCGHRISGEWKICFCRSDI